MSIIVDMNLSPRWVGVLNAAGFETQHWSEIGAATASDAEIMAVAAKDNAIVMTNDLDFGAILATTGGDKPSVIQIRGDDLAPEAIGDRVVAALGRCATDLAQGALLTLDAARERLTLLPLNRD